MRVKLMTRDDTAALVERACSGDRKAFEVLAARHRPRLERLVEERLGRRLKTRLSAEDVLQETFLRALRSLGRFECREGDAGASFLRWLSGIAVRVILEEAHRLKDEEPISLDLEVTSKEVSPSRTLVRKERLARLEEAIRCLPADYQTVLRLVRIEGLSVNETARRLDRSPNAISKVLLRALQKLRKRFGDTESLGLPTDDALPGEMAEEER